MLCGIPDIEYWWEQSRVCFKYSALRKDVGGQHKEVFKLLDKDANSFMRWSESEPHSDRLNLLTSIPATSKQIKKTMIT